MLMFLNSDNSSFLKREFSKHPTEKPSGVELCRLLHLLLVGMDAIADLAVKHR